MTKIKKGYDEKKKKRRWGEGGIGELGGCEW